jgi:hypothetical protein
MSNGEQPPVAPIEISESPRSLDLLNPNDLLQHCEEVKSWEEAVSNGEENRGDLIDEFGIFAERYGLQVKDIHTFVEDFNSPYSTHDNIALHRAHIMAVVLSPRLHMTSKVTLLTRTAELLSKGGDPDIDERLYGEPIPPFDGRNVILKMVKRFTRDYYLYAAEGQVDWSNYQHLYDLGQSCRQRIPKVGFSEMMKRIAEAKTDVHAKTLLGAFGMIEASQEQDMQIEAAQKRADRHREYLEQKQVRTRRKFVAASEELYALDEKSPTATKQ